MNGTISRSGCQRLFFCNRPALPNWQDQDSFAWPIAFVPEEQVASWAMHGDPALSSCQPIGQPGPV